MGADLKIVVTPAGRAATVDNARLQGLRIVPRARYADTCETHNVRECRACIDAARNDDMVADATRDEAFELLVWTVALSAALVTGYSLGGLLAEWAIR